MAWSWSHTAEAYRDAEINLYGLPHDDLAIIAAEWQSWDGDTFNPQLNLDAYDGALSDAKQCSADSLAQNIWDKASELQTCDNGGFNAYVCPFGCHTVPFDTED